MEQKLRENSKARAGEIADVAHVALFLVFDPSGYLTESVIEVNGYRYA